MADSEVLTVADLRRRRREAEALDARVKDLADVLVVGTLKAAADAADAAERADRAADEALAVAVKLYGSAATVAELTDLSQSGVESSVKAVPAARVKELLGELRRKAEAKVTRRTRRGSSAPEAPTAEADVPGQNSTGPDAAADPAPAASVS
ncbi:hypothetical protein [Kitasatospora sp. NPDC057541]|uniref:hypothetical protein n=1 Tax=unclassified Kitasatospora TaxID=2633591 RepID=UPI0036B146CC